jgi:hypothetical protein
MSTSEQEDFIINMAMQKVELLKKESSIVKGDVKVGSNADLKKKQKKGTDKKDAPKKEQESGGVKDIES